jgi:periplasmic protein TonB
MTGPTFRHWLTGFVFAALVHFILAAFLMGFWREAPPEAGSAERPGLEVTLFPGFHQAVRQVSPEAPPAPEHEPQPVDTALESARPIPLLAPDRAPDEVLPVAADPVAARESPTPVAAEPALRQPPTDQESGLETVSLAEVLEAAPAPEVLAPAVPTAPVALDRVQDAVEIRSAPLERAAETARALTPSALSPSEAPLEPVVVAEQPEALIGTLSPEPLLTAVTTPAEAIALVPSETASFADLAPVVAVEETPASVVMVATATETPAAPMFVVPDPVEALTSDLAAASPEPVIATEATEMVPLAVTDTREITELAEVAMVEMTAEALPVESAAVEIAQITGLRPTRAESIAIAETIETVESTAPLPEAETEARETPLPPPATEAGGPQEEEDTGTQDPPSPEIAQDSPQLPGIQDQYFRVLRDWLDRHKDYPRLAQRRGEEGTVVLAFTLNRYGMVLEHAIVRSSGHTMLDNTVEHLIRRAQPLPAIPPEMNIELLQMIVPIEFRLER